MSLRTKFHSGRPDESGMALVEFALVLPVLVLLTFGLIEFGLFFRDYLTVANSTRTGARVGSAAGSSATADYDILVGLKQAAAALPGGAPSLEAISVFKSTASGGGLPSGCDTGSVTGVCNHYSGSDLDTLAVSDFDCGASAPDRFWCPATRVDSQSAGPDYVGVYVRVTHDFVTGMFGASRTLTDEVVMRVEPRRS